MIGLDLSKLVHLEPHVGKRAAGLRLKGLLITSVLNTLTILTGNNEFSYNDFSGYHKNSYR